MELKATFKESEELTARFEEPDNFNARFENAVITEIPVKDAYYEVSNEAGGKTIIIGG